MQQRLHRVLSRYIFTFSSATLNQLEDEWQEQHAQPEPRPPSGLSQLGGGSSAAGVSAASLAGGQQPP